MDLGRVTEHRGCNSLAVISVKPSPVSEIIGLAEAGEARVHAAVDNPSLPHRFKGADLRFSHPGGG